MELNSTVLVNLKFEVGEFEYLSKIFLEDLLKIWRNIQEGVITIVMRRTYIMG